ncbi:MAG: nucleotidyl transferase AbiEii/AbiGii toxin family protein [Anaerolineales bacterium]|nr:nucleotidyl transferase AbiEii/AbiGii toxin family protein [Anaerolineales bacterium]
MKKEIKDIPASVHARLKNLAEQSGRTFQELFYYYAMERFLYRLSSSQYSNNFVLKGGLMFKGWGIPLRRPTRDIDVQGYEKNSIENLITIVQNICAQEVESDGMQFDPDSVRGEKIISEAEYQGIRIYFVGYLGKASIHLHLDVSFANVISPKEIEVKYPCLLNMPSFEIRGYPYETTISEKFESMVKLGDANDRMKDFFDIWVLSQHVEIQGASLAKAIRATFKNRKTPLPTNMPIALTSEFAMHRQKDWERFLRRSGLNVQEYPPFNEVIVVLREFIWPVVLVVANNETFKNTWNAAGSWISPKNNLH